MSIATKRSIARWRAALPRASMVRFMAGMVVVISADAAATHQSVINVMEAARRSGLSQITFATQSSAQAGGR